MGSSRQRNGEGTMDDALELDMYREDDAQRYDNDDDVEICPICFCMYASAKCPECSRRTNAQ